LERDYIMLSKFKLTPIAAALATIAVVSTSPVMAAEGDEAKPQARGAAATLMQEVVTLSRKKDDAEMLQDVPVAVTAVSGEQIEAMFANDVTDIGYKSPNVQLNATGSIPNYANFSIRGLGVNGTVLSDDPAVGVFVDGMYLGIGAGVITDTFDLESMEVLRGPQGTLFGRNVTGGAVLLNSKRPADEFGFKVRTVIGNDQNRQLMMSVDAPIAEDLAYGRLTILSSEKGDSYNNLAPGGEDIGEKDLLVVRPKLRLTPTDNLTINLSGEYGSGTSDPSPRRFIPETGKAVLGMLQAANLPIPDVNSHDVSADFVDDTIDTDWKHAIAEIEWEMSDRVTLKSITAWREVQQRDLINDVDGSAIDFFNFTAEGALNQEQFSQEFIASIQLTDSIDLTTGAFYFDQEYDFSEGRKISGGAVNQGGYGEMEHDTQAVFAQVDVALNEAWNVTVGGRMSWESKEARLARRTQPECNGNNGFVTDCVIGFEADESWRNFTPKLGAQYNYDEDTQFYGSYTKGFRSGGFNIRATTPGTEGPYGEEKIDAFEIGMKTDFADGHGRMNLALFYNEFTDLQRTVLDASANQAILNAGAGNIIGSELELNYLVGESLLLEGVLGYTMTEFDEFLGLDLTGDNIPDPGLAKKLEVAHVPHWTSFMAATYDIPVSTGNVAVRGSYSYTDESFADDKNAYSISSYELFDASVTYTTHDGKWSVSAFGKNLADEVYYTTAFILGPFDIGDLGPRRSFGVSLTYEY
jgi:iron complex outermembrane receptor protein